MNGYNEIFRLREMLEKECIPFEMFFNTLLKGYQIMYPGHRFVCSVVENDVSYGHKDDKLEIMGLLTPEEEKLDGVAGWLTADDVFSRIKKHWEKENCDIARYQESCEDCGFCDKEVNDNANT